MLLRFFLQKKSPEKSGLYFYRKVCYYIKSIAMAKNVTLKGRIIEQYPPPIEYTPKKVAIDKKNSIQ